MYFSIKMHTRYSVLINVNSRCMYLSNKVGTCHPYSSVYLDSHCKFSSITTGIHYMSSSTDLNTGIHTYSLIDYSPIDTYNTYSYTDGNIHYKNLPGELDNQNTYLSINLWDTGNTYCSV